MNSISELKRTVSLPVIAVKRQDNHQFIYNVRCDDAFVCAGIDAAMVLFTAAWQHLRL